MSYIAAGSFSGSISQDTGSLYLWGTGTFGEFHSPHRVKKITERVSQVQIGHQFGIALSESHTLYSWGENTKGQLGTGDFENLSGPTKMDQLTKTDEKVISSIACGYNFAVCLG